MIDDAPEGSPGKVTLVRCVFRARSVRLLL